MKIFFTANVLWDIYIFRYGVIKELIKDGHEVVVVAPKDDRIDFEKQLNIRHIPIEVNKRGVNPIEDLRLMLNLGSIYKREKPDIVFHYTIKPNIYGTLGAKIAKVKSIAVLTGLGYSFTSNNMVSKIARFMYKISLPKANEVWVLNRDDKHELINRKIVDEKKLFILPGEGIDLNRFKKLNLPREYKGITFLMIARAFIDKGFLEYVKAARHIKEKYPHVRFQFLGALGGNGVNGIDRSTMDALVEEGLLEYLGHRKDVPKIIDRCDCVVLPSYREGISKVLLEAAAMEKPIIATDVTGCKEIVENGKNGYLVKVKNSESLIGAMEKFMNLSQEKIDEMGKYSREKMKNEFDEKIIVNIYRRKLWNLV
ncbi:Glycosyltransferase involved in cell wall bisynthesis [Cetobacterium ceti]|uniref:Glycosyltransferase involved in cell wall bisynthesis n=1 Tax=Cetobacterium ceti TaxID=180163 RepID=A0A1T4M238_9FUSO|nr:glycosyltransferase family 4 protein [Cetobacterium ceti]SJZ60828.1 Glycosyltransferase involved in cell wall bisynthesis [Cetobacterium ceti]